MAQTDYFLKLEGDDIPGESKDSAKTDWIDVIAWSWGGSQSGHAQVATGGGAGKVQVHDLTFAKLVDKATPKLWEALMKGKHIKKATLVLRKAGGAKGLEYFKITMSNAMITSISDSGSHGEVLPSEQVSLNFSKVEIKYQPQGETGAGKGNVETTYDIAGME